MANVAAGPSPSTDHLLDTFASSAGKGVGFGLALGGVV